MAKDKHMEKCNYCTQSQFNGVCRWSLQSAREKYCAEAIQNMVKILGGSRNTGGQR